MKKFISLILSLTMMLGISSCGSAADISGNTDFTLTMQIDNPVMTVNGAEHNIDNEGSAPVIVNGRTLVPIRAIIEAMGGTVGWEQSTQTVTLNYGDDEIQLVIDSDTAYLNGTANTLDTAPTIINGRTMLPIRFISESFKFGVDWKQETQTVIITKSTNDDEPVPTIVPTEAPSEEQSKTLIAYFSRTGENYGVGVIDIGNTARIAGYINNAIDADVFEIVAKEPYPNAYSEATARAQREQQENARPEFIGEIENMEQYDTVYIGYPIWYSTMPMIMSTFLEKYDMAGKTVIPFSTHEGSGWGNSLTDLKKLCPNSTILDGYSTRGQNAVNAEEAVKEWIENLRVDI